MYSGFVWVSVIIDRLSSQPLELHNNGKMEFWAPK